MPRVSKFLVGFLICFLATSLFLPLISAQEEDHYFVNVSLSQTFVLPNSILFLTLNGNYSSVLVTIYNPSNSLVFSETVALNVTTVYFVPSSAEVGKYMVYCQEVTTWFWVTEDLPNKEGVLGNDVLPQWKDVSVTVAGDGKSFVVDNGDNLTWTFFYGAKKYPSVYQNGVLIVKDELWLLYNLKRDNNPASVDMVWTRLSAYNVLVTQKYTSKNGDYNVTWDFYGGCRPKITLTAAVTVADSYTIEWQSYCYKDYATALSSSVKLWDFGEEGVAFDWSDVVGISTSTSAEGWFKGKRLDIVFNVGSLSVGEFVLDPNFGYWTAGASYVSIGNSIRGSVFWVTYQGEAQNITWYGRYKNTGTANAYCAIYKASDLSLVGTTEVKAGGSTVQWNTHNFLAPKPQLTANTQYVLVVWGANTNGRLYYSAGATNQGVSQSLTYGSYPDPLNPAYDNNKYSVYCTYVNPIFADGFETNFDAWTATGATAGNTITVVATDPHHGTYHADAYAPVGASIAYVYKTITAASTVFVRAYVKVKTNLPATSQYYDPIALFAGGYVGTSIAFAAVYNDAGTVKWVLRLRNGATLENTVSSSTVSLDTWYCVELKAVIHGSAGEGRLYINNVEVVSATSKDTDNYGNIDTVSVGERFSSGTTTHSIYVDCVVVADQGPIGPEVTAQNYAIDLTCQTQLSYTLLRQWNAKNTLSVSTGESYAVSQQWTAQNTISVATAEAYTTQTQTSYNLAITSATTATWTFLSQTAYKLAISTATTLTWLLNVYLLPPGAQHYIVTLAWTLGTSWTLLLQSSFTLTRIFQLASTWLFSSTTSYSLTATVASGFTWTLNVLTGIQQLVELAWQTGLDWLTEAGRTIYTGLTGDEAAAIGIIFAIVVLAVCVGLIYSKRRQEE